ncbi:MAG: RagB/SusD family nutrient uptake outer membrane protein, partial [Duncaniella sp.]|nr:RagB/SusD family nutrient uptake outer membrane protein [Duncaniella sp.]
GMANPGAAASQDAMRTLVFEERQREFMFEGKRYFDIIRMINRDRSRFSTIINQYLVPKYADLDQATVKSKLSEYDALFMPIKDSELKANLQLVQNPFYKTSNDIGIGGK